MQHSVGKEEVKSMKEVIIDTTNINMSDEHKTLLYFFIEQYIMQTPDPTNCVFEDINTSYEVKLSNEVISVKFENPMFTRLRKESNHSEKVALESIHVNKSNMLSSIVGKGTFGSVHRIASTIVLADNKELPPHQRIIIKPEGSLSHKNNEIKARVVKKQPMEHLLIINNEEEILQSIPDFKSKKKTFGQNIKEQHRNYFIVMKNFAYEKTAMTLDKFIKQPLTIEQRINIFINLPIALKHQFHDRGIFHQDIKLNNIIIDSSKIQNPITFIDCTRSISLKKIRENTEPDEESIEIFKGKVEKARENIIKYTIRKLKLTEMRQLALTMFLVITGESFLSPLHAIMALGEYDYTKLNIPAEKAQFIKHLLIDMNEKGHVSYFTLDHVIEKINQMNLSELFDEQKPIVKKS